MYLMKPAPKLIVFDLDGTLNRTELFAVEVHRMLQTEFGWPAQSPEEITSIFGAPSDEYMERLLPGSDEATKQRYLKREAEVEYDYMHLAAAYDGCKQMLTVLRENGWETAVCSNSSFRYISMILNSTGLMHEIDYIQPLEKGMTEKSQSLASLLKRIPHSAAVMVGDTTYDKNAAEANQIPFIGCRYGFRPTEMADVRHTVLTPVEIPALAEELVTK